ncbi:MAG: hypothetical protein NVSMB14_13680 [Isosphaeraceae bacterium]
MIERRRLCDKLYLVVFLCETVLDRRQGLSISLPEERLGGVREDQASFGNFLKCVNVLIEEPNDRIAPETLDPGGVGVSRSQARRARGLSIRFRMIFEQDCVFDSSLLA